MSAPLIKICGITNPADAEAALAAGADFLGLIFVPASPRAIDPVVARQLVQQFDKRTRFVGVFQNHTREDVCHISESVGLSWVQLHGEESPEFCAQLPYPLIKVLPLATLAEPDSVSAFTCLDSVRYLLFEPPKTEAGAAQSADSDFIRPEKPFFIAGRLTPETVGEAIQRFQPDGVDVASGVEASPGLKDPQKLLAFCHNTRNPSLLKGDPQCNR